VGNDVPGPLRVKVKRLPGHEDLDLPRYLTPQAAGMDLRAAVAGEVVIPPGEWRVIPTGIAVALPEGFEGQVRPRSGLAAREGVGILNAPGTVDADYRGEIKVVLVNFGPRPFTVRRGERVAQLVVQRAWRVQWDPVAELPGSPRGDGGFGSTDWQG